MGIAKDMMIEFQKEEFNKKIAKILGISYCELNQLDPKIEIDADEDHLIYNYRIEFSEDSPKEILSKIERLEDGCRVYLQSWELDEEDDYEELFFAITQNKGYFQKYKDEITNLEELSRLNIPDEALKGILNRQVFIGIIGTMETFLSDAFMNLTFDNEIYFRNFIETHPEFKKRKIELREIFEESEKLKETAKKLILDTIFHNIPLVRQMYRDTFKINFPEIKYVYKYVLKRHDLVYRNGKTKKGEIVEVDQNAILDLIQKADEFVAEIMKELSI